MYANVLRISALCLSSHSERFLTPGEVDLPQVPAVELQQGRLGPGLVLALPSHHCPQSWRNIGVLTTCLSLSHFRIIIYLSSGCPGVHPCSSRSSNRV